jgi:hypothetical protein
MQSFEQVGFWEANSASGRYVCVTLSDSTGALAGLKVLPTLEKEATQ